jgi:hypothetical protein
VSLNYLAPFFEINVLIGLRAKMHNKYKKENAYIGMGPFSG